MPLSTIINSRSLIQFVERLLALMAFAQCIQLQNAPAMTATPEFSVRHHLPVQTPCLNEMINDNSFFNINQNDDNNFFVLFVTF